MATTIGAEMKAQFRDSLTITSKALEAIPDDKWYIAPNTINAPVRIAFHAIQALDAHLWCAEGDYDWNRFGVSWKTEDIYLLPGKQTMLDYLEEVRQRTFQWCEVSDEVMTGPAHQPRFFKMRLTEGIYAIRHLNHHTGELNASLRELGLTPGTW